MNEICFEFKHFHWRNFIWNCCPWNVGHLVQASICVNSLWPSGTIWGHKSGSTMVQVMACCLMALIHSLNQCWLRIPGMHRSAILPKMNMASATKIAFENYIFNFFWGPPRGQRVKWIPAAYLGFLWWHISISIDVKLLVALHLSDSHAEKKE